MCDTSEMHEAYANMAAIAKRMHEQGIAADTCERCGIRRDVHEYRDEHRFEEAK